MTIHVLLAEDQAIVRAGFRALLEGEPDLKVAGEAADGREAVELARELRPDLVLMDIRMPELDGLEATRRITADPRLAETRVLVLTTFELDEYVFGALRAGASGFLLKGGEPGELLSAIRVVAAGESLLAPSVTKRLIEAYVAQPEHATTATPEGLDELSPRELEVLGFVARGSTNREIADALYLSPLTVKTHVSRILTKLRARDRVQLVVIAYQAGLVSP
ncbi:MAG TPA: response regulator transcription factor [Gaiellaceae bacterium]|nr:response regulator transcription factor [Gaiellaceae bacterium]